MAWGRRSDQHDAGTGHPRSSAGRPRRTGRRRGFDVGQRGRPSRRRPSTPEGETSSRGPGYPARRSPLPRQALRSGTRADREPQR
jgi:hypothetical protein